MNDELDIFEAPVSTLFVTDDTDLGPLMIGNDGFDKCVIYLADGTVESFETFLSRLSGQCREISWSEAAKLLSQEEDATDG